MMMNVTVSDTLMSNTASSTVHVLPPNQAPTLTVPADLCVHALAWFKATATATDTDTPPQTLTFSLVSGPPGLVVAPSGEITWTPEQGQTGTNYSVTVRVADSGVPVLSDTKSFNILVAPALSLLSIHMSGGQANLTWCAISGKTYHVEYGPAVMLVTGSNAPVTATNTTARDSDPAAGANPKRFYRVTAP